nr:retrovirus-related Pol polyprotein from transposon TNT 1-94 [Tanacetum cinerariifolium]
MKCFNYQGESHMARQCLKPKRKKDATWFKEKVLLVEAQGNGKVLNEEELEFLADPAKAVLMANMSSYGSVFLFEDINSSTQQDALILSVFNSWQIKPMLYDSNVIAKETNVMSIADSEETLMLEEESRSKMLLKQSDPMVLEKKANTKPINYAELNRLFEDFGKRFVPERELSDEQALHPVTNQSASSPVKIKDPQELHKASLVKNNRKVHEYYLKHTMEQAAILREMNQELLGYVRDTCPDIHKPSKKLVAVIPINKKKKVRFANTITSSDNTLKASNRPLLYSTKVNLSTSACGLKPSGNTKNDRIHQTPSSIEKNKVEVQSRKVKSSLNKRKS